MRLRQDIVALYRAVHSWVGIVSGLFLFVAFYAGAVSMFEEPIQTYLSTPKLETSAIALDDVPDLVQQVLETYPQARGHYSIIMQGTSPMKAYMRWSDGGEDEHVAPISYKRATLDGQHHIQVIEQPVSQLALFIDRLHQHVGLPLPHESALKIMGIVAVLYAMALCSGVIIYLPSVFKMMFSVRLGGGFRKKWLDFHNLLGVFSLPFHIIMALTSVVFAFHDQVFALEGVLFAPVQHHHAPFMSAHMSPPVTPLKAVDREPTVMGLAPLVQHLRDDAPGFQPKSFDYAQAHGHMTLRVAGYDERYGHRGPNAGFVVMNPYTGRLLSSDYMPGKQSTAFAIMTSFFALHFGSFGGSFVRWAYVGLGLGGAFLFYTGNLLWLDARRRREKQVGYKEDSWPTYIMEVLTSGWVYGTIAGLSASACVAVCVGPSLSYQGVAVAYYAVCAAFILVGFCVPYVRMKYIHRVGAGMITALLLGVVLGTAII